MLNESDAASHFQKKLTTSQSDLFPAFSSYDNHTFPLTRKAKGSGKGNEVSTGELALHTLCKKVLEGRRLLIATNRGPVTYERDEQGQPVAKRGSGGVVTALSSLTNYTPVTWVAAALSLTDRQLAASSDRPEAKLASSQISPNLQLRFVDLEPACFEQYLNVISNPLLWFIQHEMAQDLNSEEFSPAHIRSAWWNGYFEANRHFAEAIVKESKRPETAPFVIFHDYQLYLAPGLVRDKHPDLTLLHFTHIPWPKASAWQKLPNELVQEICRSLLACDLVGFQTPADAEAFVTTCWLYLKDVKFWQETEGGFRVEQEGFSTRVQIYPISIDPVQVRQTCLSSATQDWKKKLGELCQGAEQVVVRVDRLDPSKNILAGFEAYEMLLKQHPELHEKLVFLALLVPTRESIAEYQSYREQVFEIIERINQQYGTADWQPILYFYGNDYHRSLAALSLADVVLVNPKADGMNLVAKEAVLVNERDAVLVLSKKAGAWHQLKRGALGVEPDNRQATTQALWLALTMSEREKARRAELLAQIVQTKDCQAGWPRNWRIYSRQPKLKW
jgi:trehalose 6-phosphate synthase